MKNKNFKHAVIGGSLALLLLGICALLPSIPTYAAEEGAMGAPGGEVMDETSGGDEEDVASVYDEAVASIEKYNKLDALKAAFAQVQEKEPVAVALWDMQYGYLEAKGFVATTYDRREGFSFDYGIGGVGSDTDIRAELIAKLMVADGVSMADEAAFAPYDAKSFEQLIEQAKSDEKYASFKEYTDECEEVYDRGVAALRKGLAVIDPSLEGLDEKSGSELTTLYIDLVRDKSLAPKDFQKFVWGYQLARGVLKAVENGSEEYGDEEFTKAYASLVEVTKLIDPEFEVELTDVALAVPTVPNTGLLSAELVDLMVMVVIVTGSMAMLLGAGVVVKLYLKPKF